MSHPDPTRTYEEDNMKTKTQHTPTPWILIEKRDALEILSQSGLLEKDLPTEGKDLYLIPPRLYALIGGHGVRILRKAGRATYFIREEKQNETI